MYQRVLPRDLFNEAKLLKCLGRIVLLIHDGIAPESLQFDHDTSETDGFDIWQDQSSGDLFCNNLEFTVHHRRLHIYTVYNNRGEWPAFVEFDGETLPVFDANGAFSNDFIALVNSVEPE